MKLLMLFVLLMLTSVARAEVVLPAMFSDHLVLQRERPVPVWGGGEAGAEITVRFAGQSKTATVDAAGRWRVVLDPLTASSEPREMLVGDKVIRDVLVGEVWLCAGQSNMAMTVDGKTAWLHVGGVANAKEVVRESAHPLLRQFLVEWKTNTQPQEKCLGQWTVAGPETTANFSATGYFFARELQQRLQVPVGILNASFGGSSVEGWTSREALAAGSDAEFVTKMNQLIDDYDHHEQRIASYLGAMAKWEASHQRSDPNGTDDDPERAAMSVDLTNWRPVMLPASLAKLDCPHGGVVWLRREIDVPNEFGTQWRFDFPACRANYALFLNGAKIFQATGVDAQSSRGQRPTFGKGVAKVGKNIVTIKLHGHSGASGILPGAFSIVPFNPKFPTESLAGEWLCSVEQQFPPLPKNAEPMPVAPVKGTLHWMPVPSQFNGMLHPLIPYAVRGAAWYQGESNVGSPRYAKHLQILIGDWRRRWAQNDFPFYVCQLPGFGERKLEPSDSKWAECREMQSSVRDLDDAHLVNLIDTCEDGDLHPLNKQEVGRRLALAALANTYRVQDIAWCGPVFESLKIEDGKAIVRFKHAAGGLVAKPLPADFPPNLRQPDRPRKPLVLPSPGSELQGFAISELRSQPDGTQKPQWVNAQARIDGARVIVWSDSVKRPRAVRYAWADHPVCNLYNTAGLPAFPFRTHASSTDPREPPQ